MSQSLGRNNWMVKNFVLAGLGCTFNRLISQWFHFLFGCYFEWIRIRRLYFYRLMA